MPPWGTAPELVNVWTGWSKGEQDLHATKRDSRPGHGWRRGLELETSGKHCLQRWEHRETRDVVGFEGMLDLQKNQH